MKRININGLDIIIRKVALEDAEALIEYVDKISYESDFLTFGGGEFKVTKEQEESFIKNYLNATRDLLIVAELDGKIIGNLNFNCNLKLRCRHSGEFGVSVLKDYWGIGIGRELIVFLLEWAPNANITKIQLTVREDNTPGIKLYEKIGFKNEGLISRYFYYNNTYYAALIMGIEVS